VTEAGSACPTWPHVRLLRAGSDGCDPALPRGVALLVIDNPPANALGPEVLASLAQAIDAVAADGTIAALLVTGAGDGALAGPEDGPLHGGSSGGLRRWDALDATAYALEGQETMAALAALRIPVIAALGGSVSGAGVELALAADIRVAAEDAEFAMPQVAGGAPPCWGGTQRLARLVGTGQAKLMILGGRSLDGREAQRIGLVEVLAGSGQHLSAAFGLAGDIARAVAATGTAGAAGAAAAAAAKEAIDKGLDLPPSDGLRLEAALFGARGATLL